MRRTSELVYGFPKKVSILADTLECAGIIEHSTIKELSHAAHIPQSTLRSAVLNVSVSGLACRVSHDVQEKLAAIGNFNTSDTTWIDRKLPVSIRDRPQHDTRRTDLPSAFQQMLYNKWGIGNRKKVRLRYSVPQCCHPNLATFSLTDFGQAVDASADLSVFLQLAFSLGYYKAGYAYGFQRVRVRLLLDADMQNCVTSPLAVFPNPTVALKNAELKGFLPYWDIHSSSGVLDGEYITKDDPLFQLKDQVQGNKFSAVLEVRLEDGILRSNGKKLSSAAKAVIIRTLIAKELKREAGQEDTSHGWMELARQTYRIATEE